MTFARQYRSCRWEARPRSVACDHRNTVGDGKAPACARRSRLPPLEERPSGRGVQTGIATRKGPAPADVEKPRMPAEVVRFGERRRPMLKPPRPRKIACCSSSKPHVRSPVRTALKVHPVVSGAGEEAERRTHVHRPEKESQGHCFDSCPSSRSEPKRDRRVSDDRVVAPGRRRAQPAARCRRSLLGQRKADLVATSRSSTPEPHRD
jgi:hypothetical protein